MATFRYKAYNGSGIEVDGNLSADSIRDAIQRLKKDGLYPRNVSEIGIERYIRMGISTQELALTTRQLAILIMSGSVVSDALNVLAEGERNVRFKSILFGIKNKVAGGYSLSNALSDYPDIFSEIYRGMVVAGEASGSLDRVLLRLSEYLEGRAKIVRDSRSAFIYPFFMTLVGICVLSFLFIFVMPKITRIFEDTKSALPWVTLMLIWVTNFIRYYWLIIIIGMIAVGWGVRLYIRLPSGKATMDNLILNIPWFGRLVSNFYITNLTRTLGSLLREGVPMLKALEITKGILNHTVFNKVIDNAIQDVIGGASLSMSMKKADSIPPIVAHTITVGEKGGNIGDALLKISETYGQELEADVKKGLSLLEPVLILIMGIIVGFIVLAILIPIFQLNRVLM
jgi:general secretion pathway protein F